MTHVLFIELLLMISMFTGGGYTNDVQPAKLETIFHCAQFNQHEELHVNCSYKNFESVPKTPAETVYLYLQHNLIGQLPDKTFDHLKELVLLDLSFNRIITLNRDSFAGLQSLRVLYLRSNTQYPVRGNLSLPKYVFKHLANLTILDLSFNSIEFIHEFTFIGLWNMQHLKLSNNLIENIQNDTFQYTPKLVFLNLFYNLIPAVTQGMFVGLRNLLHLNLGSNFIGSIENNAFQSLINLTELKFTDNALSSVNNKMFAGLQKLRHLYLHINSINEISNYTFENLKDLCVLDLSNNKLQWVNENTFIGLTKLEVLRLNSNSLWYNTNKLPPGSFTPLESLKQLSVQKNIPQNVHDIFILPDETMKDLKMLETLELDVNADNKSVLGEGFSTLHKLSSLVFSDACKFSLHNDTFRFTPSLTRFSSIYCNIMAIYRGAFSFLTKLKFVQLDFVCVSYYRLHNALNIIESLSKTPIEILKMNNVRLGFSVVPWRDVNKRLLYMSMRELYITNNDNCLNKRISFISEKSMPAPVSLQHLDLSNNGIYKISLNLTYVIFLNFAGNYLGPFVEKYTYAMTEINRLEYICLSNNSIENIFSKIFVNQPYFRNIDLSLNKLTGVSFELSHLVDLEILNLLGNTIRYLDDGSMINIDRLLEISKSIKIDFSNNKFQCNCYSIPFLNWTWSRRRLFINFDTYTCSFDNGSIFYLNSVEARIIDLQRECLNYSISMIITYSAICVFIVILAIIAIHRHRQKVRFILYTFRGRLHFLYYKTKFKNRFRSTKHSENKLDYIYDAFVSYSDDDREFVLNDCIEHIENDGNLKLCVHHRDFVPGEDITDNIIHAIESSRKTICIITRSFLQSYYCMFEYNMARMESIHSRNGKNVLFLVFYEQLLPEELPLVLYEVIQKQTYIEFPNDEHGNMIFWEKIKDGISA